MPLTNYVSLGRSGLRVSPMCLGAMTFGLDWGWGSDVETSQKVIDTYIERGGNFIDTANMYTKGHSEKIIGDHLGKHASRRDRVVIATKCTGNMFLGDPNAGGGGRKNILDAVDHSLRRLQTDYIDLLWAHFLDPHTPIEETLHTFDQLVRSGKVRYVGLSDHPAWICARSQEIARANRWAPITAIQIEYSLGERTVEGELIPMAREMGMGVTPWSPLKGGVLTGKYTRDSKPDEGRVKSGWTDNIDEKTYGIIDVLVDVSKQAACTPAQVALAWVQSRSGVTSTIIGARTLEQLDANLAALEVSLSDEQIARLDEASAVRQAFPFDFNARITQEIQGGTTVNGLKRSPTPLAPQNDDERH
ncbi:MAG: aldo/keto reductase [Phycisphaerae bacterium]|nr:aldo/keto reductase [Phycisphaerae bacterium]